MAGYFTQNYVNKPIKLMGLTSIQMFAVIGLMGLTVVICVSVLQTGALVALGIDAIMAIPIFIMTSKMNKEHKKGNPGYLNSYLAFMSTPRRIIDQKNVFKIIFNEHQ